MRAKRVVAGLFFGVVLVACGGATATDLFGDPASDAGTTPTATPTGNPTTPPTTPTGTPTTPPTTPPREDAGPPPKDAAPDTNRPDAARDAGVTGIQCGASKACALTDTCCASFNVGTGTYTFDCKTGQVTCAEPSTQINCDSAEDCAGATGKICCGDRVTAGSSGYYDNVTCATTCGGNDVIFCNPASPAASCGARPCVESTLLRGYYVCGN